MVTVTDKNVEKRRKGIKKQIKMNNRAYALDALRGYAIITMVLSGYIVASILPDWMSHAQVPPPNGVFNPDIFGITWVDLVFPFFLFAMGAALPFSVGRKLEKGVSKLKLIWSIVERGLKLTFFAIFIQHMYPYNLSVPQDIYSWCMAISSFVLMFFMFMRLPIKMPEWGHRLVELGAFALGVTMMLTATYANDRTFSLGYSNIIILLLANMALFGSIIYLFTSKNPIARLAVLPFVMAILLGGATEGSWVSAVLNYSPVPWMYQFSYLKYLFIVLPGSIAGEYLLQWMKSGVVNKKESTKFTPYILILSISLIVFNVYALFTRQLVLNLFVTIAMLSAIYMLLRGNDTNSRFWKNLFVAGAYMLMLGLFFEAFEGGIRKDFSTYSYYFVTSGLAFFALMAFSIMCDVYRWRGLTLPLEMAGQNPMIAYVAIALLVMPIFHLSGLTEYLNLMNYTPWLGFLKGVILTSFAVMVAMFFTHIKWFWRT